MPPRLIAPDYSYIAQGTQQLGQAIGAGVNYGIEQMKTKRYTGALHQMADFATGEGEAPELDEVRLYDKALKANAKTASQTAESYKGMMTNAAEQLADVDPKFADRMRGKMLFRQFVTPPNADDLKNENTRAAYTRRMTEQTANWLKKLQEIQGKAQGANIAEFGRQTMQGAPMTQGPEQQVTPIGETGGFTEQNIVNPQPAATREAAYTGIQERAQAAGMETPTKAMMDQYAPGAAALPTSTQQQQQAQGERRLDLTEQSMQDTKEYRNAMLGLRQVESALKARKSKTQDRTIDTSRLLTFAERAHDDAMRVKQAAQEAIEVMTAEQGEIVGNQIGRGMSPNDKRVLQKKAELKAAEETLRNLSKGLQDLYVDQYSAQRKILGAPEAGQQAGDEFMNRDVRTFADFMQQGGGTTRAGGATDQQASTGRTYGQTLAARQGTAGESQLRQQAINRINELNQRLIADHKTPLPITESNVHYMMGVIRRKQGGQ